MLKTLAETARKADEYARLFYINLLGLLTILKRLDQLKRPGLMITNILAGLLLILQVKIILIIIIVDSLSSLMTVV